MLKVQLRERDRHVISYEHHLVDDSRRLPATPFPAKALGLKASTDTTPTARTAAAVAEVLIVPSVKKSKGVWSYVTTRVSVWLFKWSLDIHHWHMHTMSRAHHHKFFRQSDAKTGRKVQHSNSDLERQPPNCSHLFLLQLVCATGLLPYRG